MKRTSVLVLALSVLAGCVPAGWRDKGRRREDPAYDVSLGKLLGRPVHGRPSLEAEEELLGTVDDVLIEDVTGRIVGLVLAVGSAEDGEAVRSVFLPVHSLRLEPTRGRLALETIPGGRAWIPQPGRTEREGGDEEEEERAAVSADDSPPAGEQDTDYRDRFEGRALETLQGTLSTGPTADENGVLWVRIRTSGNLHQRVFLGPGGFLLEAGLELEEGERIEIEGLPTRGNEGPFWIATRVSSGGRAVDLRSADGVPLWPADPTNGTTVPPGEGGR